MHYVKREQSPAKGESAEISGLAPGVNAPITTIPVALCQQVLAPRELMRPRIETRDVSLTRQFDGGACSVSTSAYPVGPLRQEPQMKATVRGVLI